MVPVSMLPASPFTVAFVEKEFGDDCEEYVEVSLL
jgi:hypothetical protein